MSTLSATSSLDDIKAAYLDNASYAEDDSVPKAKAFVTACRFLVLLTPTRSAASGSSVDLDVGLIKQEMDAASAWLEAKGEGVRRGRSVRHFSMENFR